MNFKKIIASAILSASLLTFGAADQIMDTQPVAHAYYGHRSAEEIVAGAIANAIVETGYEQRIHDYEYDYGYGSGYNPKYDYVVYETERNHYYKY